MRAQRMIGLAGLSVALVLGGGYLVHHGLDRQDVAMPLSDVQVATVAVERTDLSDSWTEAGTVGYQKQRTIRGASPGVVTWLPKSGALKRRGDALLRVDDRPVTLFYGRTPAFRDLDTVGQVGRDVRVIAVNLQAMGYEIGSQPAVGTVVRVPDVAPDDSSETARPAKDDSEREEPGPGAQGKASGYQVRLTEHDAVFTAALRAAVRRWQQNIGSQPVDGTVRRGDVLVLPGAVRVGALSARLGDDAGGDLMAVSAQAKAVTVELPMERADQVRAGQRVRVVLPDGRAARAKVHTVSTNIVAGQEEDPASGPKVTVTLGLDKPSLLARISSTPVDVQFTGTTHRAVLAVPVGALLALSGGGYGVQISAGAVVAVETGLYADGKVEITGDGIAEGTVVETTS
ncbi:hypothetical protein LWF15_08370 [Kineosporia rhizophila]|uniref:hypothetical protein n=1 Tax=Kineosporia TaxID=49184 RepID=UPI001E5EF882|nr:MULTISPECIES: hypothetical protein [Kineosporia]MCE0535522.1 hypothetical protein [Kineosporia rhizophila]GLY16686.1 peptidoglycan-binding protein [Kineosporia sp. NBRC 101677]